LKLVACKGFWTLSKDEIWVGKVVERGEKKIDAMPFTMLGVAPVLAVAIK
jgi:hypothetical protein